HRRILTLNPLSKFRRYARTITLKHLSNNVFFHKFILFLSHYAIYKITLRVISIDPKKNTKKKIIKIKHLTKATYHKKHTCEIYP
ncbi:hypothetical protein B1028_28090, partial [Escherichia coli]